MSDLLIAAILGVVEGLTEFIPVSSTGHLILVGDAIGYKGDTAAAFDVFIQLGAILAVVYLYWPTFLGLLDFKAGTAAKDFRGQRGILCLLVASLPALVVGFLAHHYIKEHLFNSSTVAAALIVGGLLMILIEHRQAANKVERIEDVSYMQCLGIGLLQCLSLWPGMSRSGSTIIGGMVCGLSRAAAAQFSFLAAVPVMVAATGYDLLKSMAFLHAADAPVFLVGFVVSFVFAVGAIRFFVSLVSRCTLVPFAIYRIILGVVVLLVSGSRI